MSEPDTPKPAAPASTEASIAAPEPSDDQFLVEDDLVIEEVSIDGMCGVY